MMAPFLMMSSFDPSALEANRSGSLTREQALVLERRRIRRSRVARLALIIATPASLLALVSLVSYPSAPMLLLVAVPALTLDYFGLAMRDESLRLARDVEGGRVTSAEGPLVVGGPWQGDWRILIRGKHRWRADTFFCSPPLAQAVYDRRRGLSRVRLYVAPNTRFALNFEALAEVPPVPGSTVAT